MRGFIAASFLALSGCEVILQREYDERAMDLIVKSDEHGCQTFMYFTGDRGERHRGAPQESK